MRKLIRCRTDGTSLFGAAGGTGSQNARSKGVPVEAIKATMLELHKIWQIEEKRHSDPDS